MAGHSKWKNIRIKKGRVDAQKGKIFTKLSKEIMMACRQGGPDPEGNFRLKDAIVRAKAASVPAGNIERLLEKARGGGEGENLEELTYEGYGPAGVAILVEAATDNRNRTAAEVRLIFSKNAGNIGESGCVGWLFERRGMITVPAGPVDEDTMLGRALEAGALDMEASEDAYLVYTEPAELHAIADKMTKNGTKIESNQLTKLPKTTVSVSAEDASALFKLLDLLEDHDDVQQVYANFDVSPEVLEALEAEA